MQHETKKTTVTLLSWTQNPLETIYSEWIQSRTTGPVPDPMKTATLAAYPDDYILDTYSKDRKTAGQLRSEITEVFEKVISMRMPLGESIHLVFLLEHCPVALREQLVRHRIGHSFGDRLGADIIPDLAGGSSFWSQTTRIIDMGQFATEGEYLSPQWLEENGDKPLKGQKLHRCPKCGATNLTFYAQQERLVCENGHYSKFEDLPEDTTRSVSDYYHEQMRWIQAAYNKLIKAGMPMEDARNVLPVAMQHRLTWSTNLSALMHVLSRRGCWLAQLGMWEPVIHGIIEQLATKIHPTFRRLIDPPCFNSEGEWSGCVFKKENEEVIKNGQYPPCSLWVNKENLNLGGPWHQHTEESQMVSQEQMPRYRRMQQRYSQLWMRDPKTGERKAVN